MNQPVEHIFVDEDGIARTKNMNVKVRMIAVKHLEGGQMIEEIAEHYGITRSDVYAALAYYYDNKGEYDERDREIEALLEPIKEESAERLARMRARLREKQGEMDKGG